MQWLNQLFSRRRRYEELSASTREHLDEKIADLMDGGSMTREQAEGTIRTCRSSSVAKLGLAAPIE